MIRYLAEVVLPTPAGPKLPPWPAVVACLLVALVGLALWKNPLGKALILIGGAVFATLFFLKMR